MIIGGGTVGAAIAYGLAGQGSDVLVLDGSDRDFRAANANFGLVWQQGKGMDMPAYQHLTRSSLERWPDFSGELTGETDIDLHYDRAGGLVLCVGEADFEQRRTSLLRLHNQLVEGDRDWEMLDRSALERLHPKVRFGRDVTGASLGHRDGAANPLRLLAALKTGFLRKGGRLMSNCPVRSIKQDRTGAFVIDAGDHRVTARRIVIAAGLGSKALAGQVGMNIPVRPERGQILVTERLEPVLPLPMSGLRQTREGTIMIGATHDDPGLDTSVTSDAGAALSARAIQRVPALAEVKLVRQWAGLRILTPDGHPVYAQSESHPGAFVALCHSGVTLAAAHATMLADAIADGTLPPFFTDFHQRRFDVPQAA
ncbi:opine oxidase subunit B [Sphingobium fuliginis]|uniref:Opine oxidase subunit B n=1 Tax=Sphingobium fuliginis (strain ATCC 27551) TaxID=336203 RepID=A0A292ZIQ0_SPHSA|nr:opine oxidase subunit B [Sphingobium fuliginis]